MSRKKSKIRLKIGDQVTPKDSFFRDKVGGVIVSKTMRPNNVLHWTVHWYNKLPLMKRDRGCYTSNELVRLKNLSVFKTDMVEGFDDD